jgi:hypothetical protein
MNAKPVAASENVETSVASRMWKFIDRGLHCPGW